MINFKDTQNKIVNITGLTNELESLYINNIYEKKDSDVLVVVNSLYEANKIYNTISNYNKNTYLFPMDDFVTSEAAISSPELMISRLETLNSIIFNNSKKIIITNLMGFLRFLPDKNIWKNSLINLKINDEIEKDKLFRKLINIGYNVETLVTKTGEISNRGYILDIFPVNEENGVRIEFFGDTIESIRYFDVNTQLSFQNIDSISIYPFSEFITNVEVEEKKQKYLSKYVNVNCLYDYLNNATTIFKDYNQIYNSYLVLEEDIVNYKTINNENIKYMYELGDISLKSVIYISSVDNILSNVKIDETINYESHDAPYYNDNFELLNKDLSTYISLGKTVVICLKNDREIENIVKYLDVKTHITNFNEIMPNKINIVHASIDNGYIYDNLVVLTNANLFKNNKIETTYKSKFKIGTKVKSTDSLTVGDYVVHNMYGIGIYKGIVALKKGTITKDYLQICYLDDAKLYIPVEKIELISKYSPNGGVVPRINKLGGSDWKKTKLAISGRLKNIANELLQIAAERKMKKGFAFNKDSPLQEVFENEFIYEETKDQLKAINLIKDAMEKSEPMDMLLCGDVGYGKTEVAFRAMFKAVCSNKQVAYLCPTTILSNQQYNSALSRFKNFPVNIGLLNRFTTKKETAEILNKLKNGKIDILFGTHRILSDDIAFKDLGLLVVDEEQRFGVTHKEKIKKYKSNVDVLTLSATPIPRTLQMSMIGIRDLALIETPPSNRYPVQTYVLEENDYIIRDAIYKELSRGGQVYILCNRIEEFSEKTSKIKSLVPDVKIGYAHGKMNKSEIEDIMNKFINKDFDILLCTTIIETGIDIPNVNTLIILNANNFGLSQLYQIRGRVGRTNRIAYAYLMYTKNKVLNEIAIKRLSAIKEFTELGSGYRIAMRDLAIRGAGDVIGSEQSGFIDTIGIELYLKMLNDEINILKGVKKEEEPIISEVPSLNVETHIDNKYVSSDVIKIEIHKMINKIDSYESLIKIKKEIEDRFGKIDDNMLIYMYEEWFECLRIKKGIEKVVQNDKYIELIFDIETTKKIQAEKLFIIAYKISPNFKLSYSNKQIKITLNIEKINKHPVYLMVELLNSI